MIAETNEYTLERRIQVAFDELRIAFGPGSNLWWSGRTRDSSEPVDGDRHGVSRSRRDSDDDSTRQRPESRETLVESS